MGQGAWWALVFSVTLVLAISSPNLVNFASAAHQGIVFLPGGEPQATLDANQEVRISGAIDFVISQCSNPDKNKSIPDTTNPIADVYIIRILPGEGASVPLSDISGVPNVVFGSTLGGAFFDQTIGLTAPAGPIGEGTYSIAIDECQDGDFGAEDFLAPNAFEVKLTTTEIPSLPTSALATKASAGAKADSALLSCRLLQAILWGKTALDILGAGTTTESVIKLINLGVTETLTKVIEIVTPEAVAGTLCIQNAKKLEGIAADPPDPNFEQLTTLPQIEHTDSSSSDPLLISVAQLNNANINEDALASGLLGSLEKFQGAEIEKRGSWALIHSRAIKDYSDLLSAQTLENNIAIDNLIAQLSTDPTSFDTVFSDLQNLKTRLQNSGLTQEERQEALNRGLTPQQIDEAIEEFTQVDFDVTTSSIISEFEDLKTKNNAFVSDLNTFSTDVQSIITTLENDVLSLDETPKVNPGGPYSGIEGSSISFDGTASSSSTPIILYEWDLDGDGQFDDATGPNPAFTYDEPFEGLVGLRVTNSIEKSNVGYAQISISDSNRAPTIESFNPSDVFPDVEIGNSLTFSVSTSDPDGDTITNQWFVNSVLTTTGDSFNFQPDPSNVGLNLIEVVSSDDNLLGDSAKHEWIVTVFDVDNDMDDWRANVDCDDTNENVNPGQTEIPANGINDDCDTNTPDIGEQPIADYTFFPASPFVNRGVQFNDNSLDDVSIVSYQWDFGDDNTSSEINPMHMYDIAGDFTVTLTVTDNDGNTDSIAKTITILTTEPENEIPLAFDIPSPEHILIADALGGNGDVARGDLNNDGFDDLVAVGGFRFSEAAVYFGGDVPFDTVPDINVNFDAGRFSDKVRLATGDVNGDNIDDLIIGAPFSDQNVFLNGAVFVAFGGDGSFDSTIDKILELNRPVTDIGSGGVDPRFGDDVAVGDVNGDGIGDIIVGVAGAVYDPFPFDEFGLGGAFEFPRRYGEAHIFFGSTSTISDTADVVLRRNFEQEGFGPTTGLVVPGHVWTFGSTVASGDVNADGIDDIIVGCDICNDFDQATGNNGKVMIYFGRTGDYPQVTVGTGDFQSVYDLLLHRQDPVPFINARFGLDVATGDFNGDGSTDILVGSPATTNLANEPGVRVYLGGSSLDANADLITTSPNLRFLGWSVGVGDFNGDGIDDILAGAPENPFCCSEPGAAAIIFGSPDLDSNIDRVLRPFDGIGGMFGLAVESINSDQNEADDVVVAVPEANRVEIVLMPPEPITVIEDTPTEIQLEGKDDDNEQLNFFTSMPPSHASLGLISSTGQDSASVTYTAEFGFLGKDRFSYKAHDGKDISNIANVEILVVPDQETPDTTPPILTPPSDLLLDAIGTEGQPVNLGTPTVIDNRDPSPIITNDAPSLFFIGTTQVTWRATDAAGNFDEAAQFVTIRDDTAPQIQIQSPNDGDNFAEGTITSIEADVTDDVGVEKVEFFEDGTKIGEDTSSPFSVQYVVPNLSLGDPSPKDIILEATAFDLDGNSATDDVTIKVSDITPPPTPQLALPPDQSVFFEEMPILTWRAVEDPSSPVTYVPRLIETSEPSVPIEIVQLSLTSVQPINILPEGDYQWDVMSVDSQGNESPASEQFSFSISTLAEQCPSGTSGTPPNCVADDSDNDGVVDSEDGCPDDPNKTSPGSTGCGNPEPAGDVPIGGKLVPLDKTALLLVGVQTTASWFVPIVITTIGFVLVYSITKRKRLTS